MALDIKLFDGDYKLSSDSHNIVVNELVTVDPTKSPNWREGDSKEMRYEYREITYHSTIDKAVTSILERKVRHSDAVTLEQLRNEIRQNYREVEAELDVRDQ